MAILHSIFSRSPAKYIYKDMLKDEINKQLPKQEKINKKQISWILKQSKIPHKNKIQYIELEDENEV